MYLAWCVGGIEVFNSILCWVNYGGMPFRSLQVQANTSLNSLSSIWSSSIFSFVNCELTLMYYGFLSMPRFSFTSCSLVKVQPTIWRFYTYIFVGVSFTWYHLDHDGNRFMVKPCLPMKHLIWHKSLRISQLKAPILQLFDIMFLALDQILRCFWFLTLQHSTTKSFLFKK